MWDNTLEPLSKKQRVADDVGLAEDAALFTTNAPSNESRHDPSEVGDNDINVILSPHGTITEALLKKTLGSICDSLGRTVYMVDSAEFGSVLLPGYTPKKGIEDSIRDSNTILLPILTSKGQLMTDQWVLVVVRHKTKMLAPAQLYYASYSLARMRYAKGMTTAFLNKYLADSQSTPREILQQCADCKPTDMNDSGTCVFAFGIYAIAQCPLPRYLSVDAWRLIIAYVLGFKDDEGVRENELFSKRELDENTLEAAYRILNKTKLEKHRKDADKFIAECFGILTVLRKVLAQMTETSGGGQWSQDAIKAASAANRSRGIKMIRDRLKLTIEYISGLEGKMKTRREDISYVLEDLKRRVAAAGL